MMRILCKHCRCSSPALLPPFVITVLLFCGVTLVPRALCKASESAGVLCGRPSPFCMKECLALLAGSDTWSRSLSTMATSSAPCLHHMHHRVCFKPNVVLRRSSLRAVRPRAELTPPKTNKEIVRQARDALRQFRELKASGKAPKRDASAPYRLELRVPLPAGADAGSPWLDSTFGMADETEWPGGYAQKFRALKPLVEEIFEGYDAKFLGMLESTAEGMGCWNMPDTTIVTLVGNATFPAFARLCEGGYGGKPLEAEHTIIAVNPEWTSSKEIGQPWDRKLKQEAKKLVDDAEWVNLYSCEMVRTSRADSYGLVLGSYQQGWRLYKAAADSSTSVGECILKSEAPLTQAEVVQALSSAAAR